MTGKHTPGPWVAKIPERKSKRPSVEIDSARSFVCDVWGWGEEVKANARLIAAAPDLLEALEEASDPINGYLHGPLLARARAAIAKARGQE